MQSSKAVERTSEVMTASTNVKAGRLSARSDFGKLRGRIWTREGHTGVEQQYCSERR